MAVIEIPKGSKKKYELDKETGLIILDRVLHTSTHYPANYGFIPRTYGDDGDPLDVLVLCSEEIDPLTLVRCYPIGYISMLDGGKNDEKIIAIPFSDPTYNPYHDLMDLPPHLFAEMRSTSSLSTRPWRASRPCGQDVNDRAAAVQVIRRAMDHYAGCFLGGPSAKWALYPTEPRISQRSRGRERFREYLNGIVPFSRNLWYTVFDTREERTIPHESSI